MTTNNVISMNAAPLTINGQPLGGGFSFAYDLGGPTTDIASQAFNFLSSNNQQDQGFLQQSIAGTQGFLTSQVSPYLQGVSILNNQNLATQTAQQLTANWFQNTALSDVKSAPNNYYSSLNQQISNVNSLAAQAITQIGQDTASSNQASVQASSNSGGGGCFITTAICESEGKADDCRELMILRKFRDEFMITDSERKKLVEEYYRIAPDIVRSIKELKNSKQIFEMLKDDFIIPCILLIEKGCSECAMQRYRAMIFACKAILSPAV